MLSSGTRLGHYEILDRVGAGGMGEVYPGAFDSGGLGGVEGIAKRARETGDCVETPGEEPADQEKERDARREIERARI